MSDTTLSVTRRTEFGKGPSRRLRRDHKIPAVLYGHGIDPVHLVLPGHETSLALKQSNVLLTLDIEGEDSQLALPRDVQRDPIKGFVEHVDLVVVRRGEKVVVDVPVETTGEVVSGAVLSIEHSTLSVRADATAIPGSLVVDVDDMEPGTSVHASEVSLPDGVELVTDADATVVVVAAAQMEVEAGAEEEAEGETLEGAEAAEAASEGEEA
jgi:large subunit ribosomal protein L25